MKICKRIISVICAAAMSVSLSLATPTVFAAGSGNGPVSYYGQLQTSGNKINGAKTNSPAQVKGMSFFWSNWSTQFWNADTVNRMVNEFDCEVLRCAFGVDDGGTPYSYSDENNLREVVEAAIANDIYVIIDWHSHGAYKNTDAAKDFFSRMARDYGAYDNVIFELYNEPTTIPWSTVKWYAEQVIPCIRQYSDNLIIVGTPTWSQDVDAAANDPISDSNLAYVLHFYAGSHFQYLRDKADYALSKNMALFVSEWGSVNADGNGGINYGSTEEWLNWMNDRQLSWCNWAINSKDETSSIFYPDGSLREAGKYLKNILCSSADYAEWRNGSGSNNSGSGDSSDVQIGKETTVTVPGTVEAEDYAYMSGVKTETCSEGGQNVGYIDSGDWMSYNINVPTSGKYKVDFRVASENGGKISLETNSGATVLAALDISATGGWQSWKTVSTEIYLEAGEYNMGVGTSTGGFNLDKMTFSAVGGTSSDSTSSDSNPSDGQSGVSFTVEAEDYAYMSGVKTETCSEGGQNVGYIDSGDWMSYNINVPTSGKYKVDFRVASENGGKISLETNSGANVLAALDISATGGWQSWKTVSTEIYLEAGKYNMGVGTSTG